MPLGRCVAFCPVLSVRKRSFVIFEGHCGTKHDNQVNTLRV
jgi:hypothetical protein